MSPKVQGGLEDHMRAARCCICGKPVPDYEPVYCCDGRDCGCGGAPLFPCVCSPECDRAVFDHIGMTFEERRVKAGIERWRH